MPAALPVLRHARAGMIREELARPALVVDSERHDAVFMGFALLFQIVWILTLFDVLA